MELLSFSIIVGSIILAMVAIDFAVIGFLPKVFKVWSTLDGSVGKILMEDSLFFLKHGDFRKKILGFPFAGRGGNNLRLLLTTKYLVIKNTRRTYIWKVPIDSIRYFEVKSHITGNKLAFHFDQDDGQTHFFEFRTFKLDDWLKQLSVVGVPESQKERASFIQ